MSDRPAMATQEQRVARQFTATAHQLGTYSAVRERLGYRRRHTPYGGIRPIARGGALSFVMNERTAIAAKRA